MMYKSASLSLQLLSNICGIVIWIVGVFAIQAPTFDQTHISFEIEHLGALKVTGQFNKLQGSLKRVSQKEWFIEGEIRVNSIRTGDSSRDKAILSDQYLNADQFPIIPFTASLTFQDSVYITSIRANIRGVTFDTNTTFKTINGQLTSRELVILRSEIGLDFGLMDTLIGDEITITIHTGMPPEVLWAY